MLHKFISIMMEMGLVFVGVGGSFWLAAMAGLTIELFVGRK